MNMESIKSFLAKGFKCMSWMNTVKSRFNERLKPDIENDFEPTAFLFPTLIFAGLLAAALVSLSTRNWGQGTLSSLDNLGTVFQGTIGVAATLVSAIVTIYVAYVACQMARASIFISYQGMCHTTDVDGKDYWNRLMQNQKTLNSLLKELADISERLINNKAVYEIFAARHLCRFNAIRECVLTENPAHSWPPTEDISTEVAMARRFLERVNQSTIVRVVKKMALVSATQKEIEKACMAHKPFFKESRAQFSGAIASTPASREFLQYFELKEILRNDLTALFEVFNKIREFALALENSTYFHALVDKMPGARNAIEALNSQHNEIKLGQGTDHWLDALAAASLCITWEKLWSPEEYWCGPEYEPRSKAFLFASLLIDELRWDRKNAAGFYSGPIWVSNTLLRLTKLTEINDASLELLKATMPIGYSVTNVPFLKFEPHLARTFNNYQPHKTTTFNHNAFQRAGVLHHEWLNRIAKEHKIPISDEQSDYLVELGWFEHQTELMRQYAIKTLKPSTKDILDFELEPKKFKRKKSLMGECGGNDESIAPEQATEWAKLVVDSVVELAE